MKDKHVHWDVNECETCSGVNQSNALEKLAQLHTQHVSFVSVVEEYIAALGAKQKLESGFRGMGHNTLQEKAAGANYHLSVLKKLIGVV